MEYKTVGEILNYYFNNRKHVWLWLNYKILIDFPLTNEFYNRIPKYILNMRGNVFAIEDNHFELDIEININDYKKYFNI